MMTYAELLGSHEPYDPEMGMSIEELYQILRQIPRKVREANYMMVTHPDGSRDDVRGLQFAQHDQSERHEFNVYVTTTRGRE